VVLGLLGMCGFPITQSPAELTFADAFQSTSLGTLLKYRVDLAGTKPGALY